MDNPKCWSSWGPESYDGPGLNPAMRRGSGSRE
jgi:hypothetical protein